MYYLSVPDVQSLNDKVDKSLASGSYVLIGEALLWLGCFDKSFLLASAEIQWAFYPLLVDPAEYNSLGF